MAQFFTYKEGEYAYWTDPGTLLWCRVGQLNGLFVTHSEIVANGFASTEGVGWVALDPSVSGILTGNYYEGVLNDNYVLLVGTSPTGTEGVDYEILISR
jgi:hypothetical protein